MEQLLLHLVADYYFQSDWMALNKNKRSIPCLVHCVLYTVPFLLLTQNLLALFLIFATHFVQDRWCIIKYFVWYKNRIGPDWSYPSYDKCNVTGYYDDWKNTDPDARPKFISTWLYIISDNTYHLVCNYLILKYLT